MKTVLKVLLLTLTLASCSTTVTNEQGKQEFEQLTTQVASDEKVERAMDFVMNVLEGEESASGIATYFDIAMYLDEKLLIPMNKLKIDHPDVRALRQKYIDFITLFKERTVAVKGEYSYLSKGEQYKVLEGIDNASEELYKYLKRVEKKLYD